MATRCTDISENKRLNQASPMAMAAFIVVYILMTALMKKGFLYFICLIVAYIVCQILFYYKPRFVFLTARFLFTNSYLSPSFRDEHYLHNEKQVEELSRVLKNEGPDVKRIKKPTK